MLMVNSSYLKELNLVASYPWDSGIWKAFSSFIFFSLHSGCHNIPSVFFFFFWL